MLIIASTVYMAVTMNHLECSGRQHRILVVDDDHMLNALFCNFLNSKGFVTISAESLQAAITVFNDNTYVDLVLLDYQLGDGSGMELFSAKAFVQLSDKPPVIMVSANQDPDFLEACFVGGASDYIIKPVNLFLLALKVQALLNSVALQQLISQQNTELEAFKRESEREEAVAKFTYEYLLRRNSYAIDGITIRLQSFASFSGDMALARRSPTGDLFFMLADATGHGLSAAITIMPVVTIFNTMVDKGYSLPKIISEMNKKLLNDTPEDRFVAAILMEFNYTKNTLSVWNGAMPSVYWIKDREIIYKFPSTTMALGILDEAIFDDAVTTLELPTSGFICAHSDGLSEQVNAHNQPFTVGRIERLLVTGAGDVTQLLTDELQQHVGDVKYNDDVSICVLEPAKIFAALQSQMASVAAMDSFPQARDAFSLTIKITGDRLASCELPVQCNQFLQSIALDRASCHTVFAILNEMVSNGLDHGVLRLPSDLREGPDSFSNYVTERARRLNNLSENDYIELNITWKMLEGVKRLVISCRDSGTGFDPDSLIDLPSNFLAGRGLMMIRKLATVVEIIPPGNEIRVIL